jgi:uncharacterized membrane protein YtjA (UPF0391 family)
MDVRIQKYPTLSPADCAGTALHRQRSFPLAPDACRPRVSTREEIIMLRWAIICAVVAIIAGALGFTGVAGAAATVAKVLFFLFLAVFLILMIAGFAAGKKISSGMHHHDSGLSPGR